MPSGNPKPKRILIDPRKQCGLVKIAANSKMSKKILLIGSSIDYNRSPVKTVNVYAK